MTLTVKEILEEHEGAYEKHRLARRFVDALPFLAFFVVLFFAVQHFFGVADALLGIVFLFFSRTIVNEPGLSFANYLHRVVWFFVMVICSVLAGLNATAMVIVTVLYLFVITVTQSDDYLPRNFYWLGMGYLLLLVYPTGAEGAWVRLAATVFSVVLTTGFIYLMKLVYAKTGKLDVRSRDRKWVRRAFNDVGGQLQALADMAGSKPADDPSEAWVPVNTAAFSSRGLNEAMQDEARAARQRAQEQGNHDDTPLEDDFATHPIHPKRTFKLVQDYARMEYGTVLRQGGLLSGRQCYTFALLLCCEQIADLIHATSRNAAKIGTEEKRYFEDLSQVFFDFGQGRITGVSRMAATLENFLETHGLELACHEHAWQGILEAMLRAMRDTRMSTDDSTPILKSLRYRLRFIKENFSLRNTQVRFALQLAISVGFAMVVHVCLQHFTDMLFTIWVPIIAFTILNTFGDETLKSTFHNTVGTVVGIAVFGLVVHFIPDPILMPLVVTFSYLVILMDISPAASTAAGTQMALTALYSYEALGATMISRVLLLLVAVLCVVMIVFMFLRTRRSMMVHTKVQEMERIDFRLVKTIHDGIEHGRVSMWRTVQLLYYVHMNAWLLQTVATQLKAEEDVQKRYRHQGSASPGTSPRSRVHRLKRDVDRVLQANYKLAMDAEHAVMLLDPRRASGAPDSTQSWKLVDSTGRLEHIDATAERLDEKLDELEHLSLVKEDREHD